MSSSKSYGDHIDKRIARLSPDARDLHKLLVDIPSRPEASLPDYDAGYEAFRSMSQTDREELEVVLVALVNDRDEHTSILASLAYARTAMDSQIVEEAKRIMHRETGRPRDLPMGHIEAFWSWRGTCASRTRTRCANASGNSGKRSRGLKNKHAR